MDKFSLTLLRAAISSDAVLRETLFSALTTKSLPIDPVVIAFIDWTYKFSEATGSPPTPASVEGTEFEELFKLIQGEIDLPTLLWALNQLTVRVQEDQLASILLKGMKILKAGDVDSVHGNIRGLQDSVNYLRENLPDLTVGVIEEEVVDVGKEYRDRKSGRIPRGYDVGFSVLDSMTSGMRRGELLMVNAYAGQGKSYMLQNMSYYLRIIMGLTVMYWSTEQKRQEVETRMIARHSLHDKFGLMDGISLTAMAKLELSQVQEQKLLDEIIPDWRNSRYPPFIIKTAPRRAPFSYIAQETNRQHMETPIDVVVVDYPSQLRPSRSRREERDELTELIIEMKQYALNFDSQRGCLALGAAQTNPQSFIQAIETGRYTIRSAADSAEFERSADLLMWILRRREEQEKGILRAGVLKFRRGAILPEQEVFDLQEDFDHSFIGDKTVIDKPDSSEWKISL